MDGQLVLDAKRLEQRQQRLALQPAAAAPERPAVTAIHISIIDQAEAARDERLIEIGRAGGVIALGAFDPQEGDALERARVAMLGVPAREAPRVLHVALDGGRRGAGRVIGADDRAEIVVLADLLDADAAQELLDILAAAGSEER